MLIIFLLNIIFKKILYWFAIISDGFGGLKIKKSFKFGRTEITIQSI